MAAPRQMTANTLNALKGWPSQSAVDYVAKLDSSVTVDPVLAGSVVSLNASGNYILGVGTNDSMPLFLFNNSDDQMLLTMGATPLPIRAFGFLLLLQVT